MVVADGAVWSRPKRLKAQNFGDSRDSGDGGGRNLTVTGQFEGRGSLRGRRGWGAGDEFAGFVGAAAVW